MMEMEKASFEDRLQTVQNMIGGIEGGKLPLEEAMKQFEEGMRILGALEGELKEMNRRLTVLRQEADGTDQEIPMEENP